MVVDTCIIVYIHFTDIIRVFFLGASNLNVHQYGILHINQCTDGVSDDPF